MKENKSKSDIQLVECSKCHKEVAATEGVTKPSGFICNDCLKKKNVHCFLVACVVWL